MASSPWGTIQNERKITRGVHIVSTSSHGGIMVAKGYAHKHLTPCAIKRAINGVTTIVLKKTVFVLLYYLNYPICLGYLNKIILINIGYY